MEKTQAQKDRAIRKAEKQGYLVETYKKGKFNYCSDEHTYSSYLDNQQDAQFLGGNEDNITVAVMSHDFKIAIQQGRQEKNWTQ